MCMRCVWDIYRLQRDYRLEMFYESVAFKPGILVVKCMYILIVVLVKNVSHVVYTNSQVLIHGNKFTDFNPGLKSLLWTYSK